jgi:hypothetical protein
MGENLTVHWILCAATALWFGFAAWRAGRGWVLWGIAGALFGLVTTTVIFGVFRASTIPYSDEEARSLEYKWSIISAVSIFVVGTLVARNLMWQGFRRAKPPAQTGPTGR